MSFDGNGTGSVLIDRATFHDFTLVDPDHFECMVVFGIASMTIQNSRFSNCMIYDVAFSLANTPKSIVVQNNWFGDATNGWAVNFMHNDGSDANIIVRYNSFADGDAVTQSSGTLENVQIVGNIIGTHALCLPSASYRFNLWTGGRCSGDDRVRVPFGYTLAANQLTPDRQKAASVRLVFEQLGRKRASLGDVLKALRRAHLPSPNGHWSKAVLRSLVADPFYASGRLGRSGARPLVAPATARAAAKYLDLPVQP